MGPEQEQRLSPALENSLGLPEIRKTLKMQLVERVVGKDVRIFLQEVYSREGMTVKGVAEEISNLTGGKVRVCDYAVRLWLKKFEIPRKTWVSAVYREERRKSLSKIMRALWQDPETRVGLLTTVHSPEAREKRSKSLKASWEREPQKKAIEKRRATMGRKRREEIKEVLGEDPKETLDLLYWGEGLTGRQIGEKLRRRESTILRWMKELGVERRMGRRTLGNLAVSELEKRREQLRNASKKGLLETLSREERLILVERYLSFPPKTLRELGDRLGISREWVRQKEIRALGLIATPLDKVF